MGYEISVVFATDLYPNELEGDEPEPIELIKWPISELDTLIESDDFREGRAIAALALCKSRIKRIQSRSSG